MGTAKGPEPVKLICGILACDEGRLESARNILQESFGAPDLISDVWPFNWTDYYERETGDHIVRQFVSFERLVDPGDLARIKLLTNEIEIKLAARDDAEAPRPVNLDPGYVCESKLVLATTKDFSHRVYIGQGIYAEVTLHWHRGGFEPWPWTYLDYRSDEYRNFFASVRHTLHSRKLEREK